LGCGATSGRGAGAPSLGLCVLRHLRLKSRASSLKLVDLLTLCCDFSLELCDLCASLLDDSPHFFLEFLTFAGLLGRLRLELVVVILESIGELPQLLPLRVQLTSLSLVAGSLCSHLCPQIGELLLEFADLVS